MRHPDAPRGDRLPGQGGRPLRARRRKQQYAARHRCAARRIRSSAVCAVPRPSWGRAARVRQGYVPSGPRRPRQPGIRSAGAAPPASAGDTLRRGRAIRARQGYAPPRPSWGRAVRVSRGYAPPGPRYPRPPGVRPAAPIVGPRRPRQPGIRPAGAALSAPAGGAPCRAHRGAALPASAGTGPCARQAALIFVHASENTVTKSPRSWNTVQRSSTSCGGLNVSSLMSSSSSRAMAALLGEQ